MSTLGPYCRLRVARWACAWQHVDHLIAPKRPREYDQAVAILIDLRALGNRDDRAEAFADRLGQLRERHLRKPSLLERFDKAGLTVAA